MENVQYTVSFGNPFDGIQLFGPFDDFDEALEFANSGNRDDAYHIVELQKP